MSDPDLGPCCSCEKTGPDVRNILMLNLESPTPGRGWGCLVCDLPQNGDVAVVCDACLDAESELRFACRGYPGQDGRVPIEELITPFKHDESRHFELEEVDHD